MLDLLLCYAEVFLLNAFFFCLFEDHRCVLAKLSGCLLGGSVAHAAPQLLPGNDAPHHGGRHCRAERQRLLCIQPAGEPAGTLDTQQSDMTNI